MESLQNVRISILHTENTLANFCKGWHISMIVRSFPFLCHNLKLTLCSRWCSGCRVLSPPFDSQSRKADDKELCIWTWSSNETTSNSDVSLPHHELRTLQEHGDIRTFSPFLHIILAPLLTVCSEQNRRQNKKCVNSIPTTISTSSPKSPPKTWPLSQHNKRNVTHRPSLLSLRGLG